VDTPGLESIQSKPPAWLNNIQLAKYLNCTEKQLVTEFTIAFLKRASFLAEREAKYAERKQREMEAKAKAQPSVPSVHFPYIPRRY